MIVGAVYVHWLYSRMLLHNFGSVFQFACPPLPLVLGNYAAINVIPDYPPHGVCRGQHRGFSCISH